MLLLVVLLLLHLAKATSSEATPKTRINGIIAAFADLDNDYQDELFSIEDGKFEVYKVIDKQHAQVSFDVPREYDFERKTSCPVSHGQVVSLIPSDFTGNGLLDLLIVTKIYTVDVTIPQFSLSLITNASLLLHESCKPEPKMKIFTQPLVLDVNGDMIPDLLTLSEEGKRVVWTYNNKTQTFKLLPTEFNNGDKLFREPAYSNAFVDLNGDTIPDVFIDGEEEMEYWFLGKHGYNPDGPDLLIPHPEGAVVIGQSSFIDFDLDRVIDHILPVCYDEACSNSTLLVFDWETKGWISKFARPNSVPPKYSSEAPLKFQLSSTVLNGLHLPLTLRNADWDFNGLIDFVTIIESDGSPAVAVLRGACDQKIDDTCISYAFFLNNTDIFTYPDEKRPINAAFIDLGKSDGKPDIIVTLAHPHGSFSTEIIPFKPHGSAAPYCFLVNWFDRSNCSYWLDNYGIKFYVGSALWPEQKPFYSFLSELPIPSNAHCTHHPGVHLCYKLSEEFLQQSSCIPQLTQSAFLALQMPYTIIGIGTGSEMFPIEKLTVSFASPNTSENYLRSGKFRGRIAPGSQWKILSHPYHPNCNRGGDANNYAACHWKLYLIWHTLTIGDFAIVILLMFLVTCVAALYYHCREKEEDLARKKEYKRHVPR